MGKKMEYKVIFEKIVEEIYHARKKHPKNFHSHHEAYAIIKEEFEEWWDSVKADKPDEREMISVLAMGVLSLVELPTAKLNLTDMGLVNLDYWGVNLPYSPV
jgi:predicted RNase H-like HicB family nuclease